LAARVREALLRDDAAEPLPLPLREDDEPEPLREEELRDEPLRDDDPDPDPLRDELEPPLLRDEELRDEDERDDPPDRDDPPLLPPLPLPELRFDSAISFLLRA
jgi:hypothetical protein